VLFNWVKAHVGMQGNEMADRLAKMAATDDIGELVYDKIQRETTITEGKVNEVTKWQEQWTSSTSSACTIRWQERWTSSTKEQSVNYSSRT